MGALGNVLAGDVVRKAFCGKDAKAGRCIGQGDSATLRLNTARTGRRPALAANRRGLPRRCASGPSYCSGQLQPLVLPQPSQT